MAPNLSEDEIDDLIYFARAGELSDLQETLASLSAREGATASDILAAARDDSKSTSLHMAAGNGNLGTWRGQTLEPHESLWWGSDMKMP